MISLGGGLPNPSLFPFKSLSFTVDDGTALELSAEELSSALQYSDTPGMPALRAHLEALQIREHGRAAGDGWSVSVTTGSQEGIAKAVDMLVGPDDTVLVDDPMYAGTLALMRPIGCDMRGVRCDLEGMVPGELDEAVRDLSSRGIRPRVLYTVPTGQNPSGSTASEARKRELYELACEHDLIVLEDDPYRFLHYGPDRAPATADAEAAWQRPREASLFSMDTQGRVMRFDSLSKILSSGLRLGFVTGPDDLMVRLNLHTQASNLHPSGVSQALCAKLLTHWGEQGWERHVKQVALYYMRRRDVFEGLAKKYLSDYATWTTPTAGMFVWFDLNGVQDTQELIQKRAIDANVILLPGQAFSPSNSPSSCVRAAFSTATEEEMDLALSRFAGLLEGAAA